MLLWLRKIIFYLFFLFYLMATPYLVLYALGNIFNPLEGEFVKTGVVSIESFPRTSTVHVGGRRYAQKTPTIVHDLLPGRYSLRVSRKGFESWEKEIEIFPEKATLLEPVVLMPKKPQEEILSERSFVDFVSSVVDSKIFLWEDREFSSRLWKVDLFFKREEPVRWEASDVSLKIKSVESQKGSPFIALHVIKDKKEDVLFWNLEREKKRPVALSEFQEKMPDKIFWDAKNPDPVFLLEDGRLSRLDLRHKNLASDITAGILGLGLKSQRLYLIDQRSTLYTLNSKTDLPWTLQEGEALKPEFFSPAAGIFYDIEVFRRDFFQKDLILLKGIDGSLVANRLPHRLIESGVLEIVYGEHSEEEKILYWKKEELGVIQFPKEQEGLFEKGPVMTPLYRWGKHIHQAFWAFNDSHILFLDGDNVYLIEAQGPEPRLNRLIKQVASHSSIAYQEDRHTLFYLDVPGRRLVRRKLTE